VVRSVPENKAGLWLSKLSTPGDSEEMQHAQVLTARPSPGGDVGAQPGPVRVCCGSAARELLVSPRDRERSMWAWLRVMRRGHGMQGVEGCKRCSELQRMQGVQQAARGAAGCKGCKGCSGVQKGARGTGDLRGPLSWADGCSRGSALLCPHSRHASRAQLQATLPSPKDILRVSRRPRGTKPRSHRGDCCSSPADKAPAQPRAPARSPSPCAALRGERGQPPAAAEADHVAANEIQTLAER